MIGREVVAVAILIGTMAILGCQATSKRAVLPAPVGTNVAASRHNNEGMNAYQQGQWESAKQHFEEAIAMSPDLAEAHYNLGLTLYRLKAVQEGDRHFIQAANLAPGNKIIWDAPPLSGAMVPDTNMSGMLPDGHMHGH